MSTSSQLRKPSKNYSFLYLDFQSEMKQTYARQQLLAMQDNN